MKKMKTIYIPQCFCDGCGHEILSILHGCPRCKNASIEIRGGPEYKTLEEQLAEARELVRILFGEICQAHMDRYEEYDHGNNPIFKGIQEKLIEWRMIKEEECVRR